MKNKIPTISITAICLLALIVLSSGIQSEKGGKMQQNIIIVSIVVIAFRQCAC